MVPISRIGRFSAAARSLSTVIVTCCASKASEFWTMMNLPEACAFMRTCSATSKTRLGVAGGLDDHRNRQAAAGAGQASAARRRRPARRPPSTGAPGGPAGSPVCERVRSDQSFSTQIANAELVSPPIATIEKSCVEFGQVLGQFPHLVDIGLGVVAGRIGRRVDQREQGAGILFRRELGRGVDEQESGERGEHDHDHQRHRPVLERTGDQPLVAIGETFEAAVDETPRSGPGGRPSGRGPTSSA